MPRVESPRSIFVASASILCLVTLWYILTDTSSSIDTKSMGSVKHSSYKFEAIRGFFAQSEDGTEPQNFDYMAHDFGLLDRTYGTDQPADKDLTQWQRFEKYVGSLPRSSGNDGVAHKVVYVGRHGEGYHNVGEAKYGTKAWDDYWSKLDGDGELLWDDAHLTDKGKDQAKANNDFLKRQFEDQKMPYPARYYSSPLYRCLETANLTYSGIDVPADKTFKPLVKEMMREVMGEHTCDRRSTKSVIHEAFPWADIESGFTEKDELWQVDHRETHDEHDVRTQNLLEDVFEHDDNVFISFTSHSGAIASLQRVLGHREFRVPTGGMMPFLIKRRKVSS